MGPSPPRSHFSQTLPYSSPSSQSQSFSTVGDLFFRTSERDTHILTQALTHELSSSRGLASSSPPPPAAATSASCSSSSLSEALSRSFKGTDFWQSSEGLSVVRAMLQQHQQTQTAAMASGRLLRQDGFLHTEQNFLQKGSPFPSNSPSPASAPKERPGSPFSSSTLSTNSTISMPHTAHIYPNNQVSEDGIFASTNSSFNNASEMSNLHNIPSSTTTSIALSSQASMGAAGGKVIKRRSRVSSKSPIAVISADALNFRAMVQHLTGIPSSSSSHLYGSSGMPVLKTRPISHPYTNTVNLPTLDTSACFLGPNPMVKSTLQGYPIVQRPHQISSSSLSATDLTRAQGQNVDSMFQSNLHHKVKQSAIGDHVNPINYGLSSCSPSPSPSPQTLHSLWDSADSCKPGGSLGQFPLRQAPIVSESLQIEEHPPTKSPYNSVDSWLPFDGALANHSSNMEIARMA